MIIVMFSKLYKYIIINIFIIFVSCFITKIKPLKEGGFRPKRSKFEFTHFNNKSKCQGIDTNAIYITKHLNIHKELSPGDTVYKFYRFFPEGQAYNSLLGKTHFPTVKEINNLYTGLIGYYKIEGKKIYTEFFEPFGFGEYRIAEGEIVGDSIVFYSKYTRGWGRSGGIKNDEPLFIIRKSKEPWMIFYSKPNW